MGLLHLNAVKILRIIRSRHNFIILFEDQDFRPIRYQTGHPISEIDSDIRDFVEEVMPFF